LAGNTQDQKGSTGAGNITDHLANERTYLAWLRTGIATIGLGFVVARFGLLIRELTGISSFPESTYHLSSIIGIALVIGGGFMVILAFTRFSRNQDRIQAGIYEPSKGVELATSFAIFAIAILLIAYLLLTL
jgi:putative membrane protein